LSCSGALAKSDDDSLWEDEFWWETGKSLTIHDLPMETKLIGNYPNPFNPATAISFQLSTASFVELKVYDLLGREIGTLLNEELLPGWYTTQWNGSEYASGVYLYRIQAGRFVQTSKFVLLK
jgi:hypothetical protein